MLICSSLIAGMSMENTKQWNTELGVYWQTVFNMGLFPVMIIGIILFAGQCRNQTPLPLQATLPKRCSEALFFMMALCIFTMPLVSTCQKRTAGNF